MVPGRPPAHWHGILAAFCLFAVAFEAPAALQSGAQPPMLQPDHPVVRQLAGGEVHGYNVAVQAGQFLHLVAEQQGIDVVLELFDPAGKKVGEVDSPVGAYRPEHLRIVIGRSGSYRVAVRGSRPGAASGRYELRLEELRPAGEADRTLVAADDATAEALRQEAKSTTEESLRAVLNKYQQALGLYRQAGDGKDEAATLGRIGRIHRLLGAWQDAVGFYNEALPRARAARDTGGEGDLLQRLGVAYNVMGEPHKGVAALEAALPLLQSVGDVSLEASTLTELGVTLAAMGERDKAINRLNRALGVSRSIQDRRQEALALAQLGRVYSMMGEQVRARQTYMEALPLFREAGDRRSESGMFNNIGTTWAYADEPQRAIPFYEEALPIKRASGDRYGEAAVLNNMGWAYDAMGEPQRALDALTQALAVFRALNDRRNQANSLTNIGRAYVSLGDREKALEYFTQALPLRRNVADRAGEALTLYNLGRVQRDRGSLAEARAASEAALGIVESLRGQAASEQLRSAYLASVRGYYDLQIDILMRLHRQRPADGYLALALETSERARARSLLDILAERAGDLREGVDRQLLERERALGQALNAKAARQTQLLSGRATAEQLAVAAKEIDTLANEYQDLQARIRSESPRYAALTQPPPLAARDVQQRLLDADAVLLEYALGEDRSYLWAVSREALVGYELPARATIEAAARRLYEAVKVGPDEQAVGAAEKDLGAILLTPIAEEFRARRLVIVADGALQYVPFAALSWPSASGDTRRPLIAHHEIVSLPSASALAVMRREVDGRPPAPRAIAVLADPVFSADDVRLGRPGRSSRRDTPGAGGVDEGLTAPDVKRAGQEAGFAEGSTRFGRLIGTRREAMGILSLVPGTDRKEALDFDASRQTATSAELAQYRIVHFATHGLLNSAHPALSGIVLSLVDRGGHPEDGFLRLHDIYNLKLPVDLVVLSACQTALGREIRGEGLIGLTRGFMYAGAPRVVATLWKVDDRATAALMQQFYRGMLGPERLRPAAALRAAQIALAQQKRWQSPYYWAGFVLQGEWR